MEKELLTKVNFSIEPVGDFEKINDTISKARVRIFYTGLNRNLTYITEEFANKLLQTLPYTPVGGLWINEDEDFSDHGGSAPSNREKFRAFGVVPAEPNIQWENHLDNDGVLRRYACCDVYLWTARYQAARDIPKKAQSMELFLDSIKGDWKRDGSIEYFEFTDGCFFGLAALGKDVEPCFEGAAFYNLDESAKDFFEELRNYALSATNNEIGGTKMDNIENDVNVPVVDNEVTEPSGEDTGIVENTENVENVENVDTNDVSTEETPENVENTEPENNTDNMENTENQDNVDTNTDAPITEVPTEDTTGNNNEDKTEYNLLLAENETLKSQIADYEQQVTELLAYKAEVEKNKKQALLDKYSNLLDEETYQKYVSDIDTYSYDGLKRDISVTIVENNENTLFNKTTEEPVVVNLENNQSLSGAARLMSKYYKN